MTKDELIAILEPYAGNEEVVIQLPDRQPLLLLSVDSDEVIRQRRIVIDAKWEADIYNEPGRWYIPKIGVSKRGIKLGRPRKGEEKNKRKLLTPEMAAHQASRRQMRTVTLPEGMSYEEYVKARANRPKCANELDAFLVENHMTKTELAAYLCITKPAISKMYRTGEISLTNFQKILYNPYNWDTNMFMTLKTRDTPIGHKMEYTMVMTDLTKEQLIDDERTKKLFAEARLAPPAEVEP